MWRALLEDLKRKLRLVSCAEPSKGLLKYVKKLYPLFRLRRVMVSPGIIITVPGRKLSRKGKMFLWLQSVEWGKQPCKKLSSKCLRGRSRPEHKH